MKKSRMVSRRNFLKHSAAGAALAAGAFPALAKPASPNEKVRVAIVGLAGIGGYHLEQFLANPGAEIAALCDVDALVLAEAREKAGGKPDTYGDYRRVLDRDDIDGVVIATPNHWHGLITIHACQAGKDVYVEKPLATTIEEGRAMVKAARRYDRIVQMGTQQRSQPHFRHVCELIRNGRLGKISLCRTWFAPNAKVPVTPGTPPPPSLDWDMWLGPLPYVPYHENYHPFGWRGYRAFAGAMMTDWGVHLNDIVHWAMDMDRSGPVRITGKGQLESDNMTGWAQEMEVEFEYPEFKLVWLQTNEYPEPGEGYGIQFVGEKGVLYASREGYKIHSDEPIDEAIGSDDVRLYRSYGHQQNWLDCIKSREAPICDVETGHHSTAVCHLGNISTLLGRPVKWDPLHEVIVGDAAATRMLGRPYRAPWHL